MNTPSKVLLLAVLVIAAAGIAFLMSRGEEPPPDFTPPEVAQPDAAPAPDAVVETPPETREEPAEPAYERREVESGGAGAEHPQGARGRVIDPAGQPLAGVTVYLMEGGSANPLEMMMLAAKGVVTPPVARTETGASGQFALGVARPDPQKRYEIRAVSDRFVEKSVPNVHIAKATWYEAGTIQLDRGTLVFGRVTVEGSGLPLPNAQVTVKPLALLPVVTPTPGREHGLVATTDATGTFRVENAPVGAVSIAAVAPGYAKVEKPNVMIVATGENQVLFELPEGASIAGMVTDAAGEPVANVKISVTAISSKTPAHTETRTAESGRFEAIGLVQGDYMLTAAAPGFVQPDPLKPIQAGDQDVRIVLQRQGSARLVVYDKNGRLLTRYAVSPRRYFKAQDQIAASMSQPQQARPGRDGVFTVEGLDPDTYVFQVEAEGHAKAFSQPFEVVLGQGGEPPLVEVRLDEGGKIEGVVLDSDGKPLPGVQVRTLPNDLDENPFTEMFGGIIPYKVTRTGTRTDASGAYRLALLTPGTYQLKFVHPEHYDLSLKDHEVAAGRTTTVQPVTMRAGTVVSGQVRVDGKPASQVKVTLTAANDASVTNPTVFTCSAVSGNDGAFVMDKRVPPGSYHLTAARQTLENPLLQIADLHRTKQEITLGLGQKTYFVTVDVPSQ